MRAQCVCLKSLWHHLLVSHLWRPDRHKQRVNGGWWWRGRAGGEAHTLSNYLMLWYHIDFGFAVINRCVCIFQLEKQKRLERIRQKRAQLEELILQVCSTPVCILSLCVCLFSHHKPAEKQPNRTTHGNHLWKTNYMILIPLCHSGTSTFNSVYLFILVLLTKYLPK